MSWKFINSHITINLLNVKRWNLNTTWVQIQTVCTPSLGVPNHVIAISETENRQKVDNFKPVNLGNDRCYWKKLCNSNVLLTTFIMIMIIVIYSALDKILPYYYFFLCFYSITIYFSTTKRRWILVWAITDIQKYSCPPKIEGAMMGEAPKQALQNSNFFYLQS